MHVYGLPCVPPGPKVINVLSRSSQLRLKFVLLLNVKMPTFMSRINIWFDSLNLKFQLIWVISVLTIYEESKFHVHPS